jgi:hypothetical protein
MLNFKSLIAVAAITTIATMSIAQAAGTAGRKMVHAPKTMSANAMVRASHAEMAPAVDSGPAYRGFSAPAGR